MCLLSTKLDMVCFDLPVTWYIPYCVNFMRGLACFIDIGGETTTRRTAWYYGAQKTHQKYCLKFSAEYIIWNKIMVLSFVWVLSNALNVIFSTQRLRDLSHCLNFYEGISLFYEIDPNVHFTYRCQIVRSWSWDMNPFIKVYGMNWL